MKDLLQIIETERKRKRWSEEEVARMGGISRTTYRRCIRGKSRIYFSVVLDMLDEMNGKIYGNKVKFLDYVDSIPVEIVYTLNQKIMRP